MKDNETLVKRLREKQKFYDHFLPGSNETGLLLEEAAAALEASAQTPRGVSGIRPHVHVECDCVPPLSSAQALAAASREALLEWERKSFAVSNGTQVWVEFQGGLGSITDDLIASGILQDAAELQREAEARALKSAIEALAAVVKAPRCSKCSRLMPLLSVRGEPVSEQEPYTPTTEAVREAYLMGERTPPYIVNDGPICAQFDRWLAAHDAEVARAAAEKAWDEGQKSGMRYTDRMRAAYEIGRPELPGPPSPNPYRLEQNDE